MRTHSPGARGSSESSPTLMTRLTPLTSTLARSGWSGSSSITSPGMPRHMRSPPGLDQIEDCANGVVDGGCDRLAEAYSRFRARGLAADDQHLARFCPEHAQDAHDHVRLHPVAVEEGAVSLRRPLRLNDVHGTGGAAARRGVDENRPVKAIRQVVSQVHAADSVVGDGNSLRELALGQPPGDLDTEAVVAEEDVAHAGDQRALRGAPRGRARGTGLVHAGASALIVSAISSHRTW